MSECNDERCPVHGKISVRGNVFTGTVVSAKPDKTITVQRKIVQYVPKYERYKKIKSKIYAHNPSCIDAKENDIVRVGETRRLSKTKNFVVMEIIGKKKMVEGEEDPIEKRKKKGEKKVEKEEKKGKEVEKEEKKGKEVEKEEKKGKEVEKEEEKIEEEEKIIEEEIEEEKEKIEREEEKLAKKEIEEKEGKEIKEKAAEEKEEKAKKEEGEAK